MAANKDERIADEVVDQVPFAAGGGRVEVVERPVPLGPAGERARVADQHQPPPAAGQRQRQPVRLVPVRHRPVGVAADETDGQSERVFGIQ